ncbi:MAG: hypothetical protein J0I12_24095 [Candidatus Eremiobacteraeota bacterium]|nr:hypothetical protein [Candidatus Eremiobacteraeota bacterium]
MKIQLPVQVQSAFDRFRQSGTLGAAAEKSGPDMELIQFTALRANLEDVQALDKLDDQPGMDNDPTPGNISLTAKALEGKPYEKLEACVDGADSVIIHKSAGDKQSFEMATNFEGGPAYLIAVPDGDRWMIGSNRLVMKDGQPEMTEMGIPRCAGEFLLA